MNRPIRLVEWLMQPWGSSPLPFEEATIPEAPTPSRLQVYAALFFMNGLSPHVIGWGVQRYGGDENAPYNRTGLDQNEALCLHYMSAFIDGWMAASAGNEFLTPALQSDEVAAALRAEYQRIVDIKQRAKS